MNARPLLMLRLILSFLSQFGLTYLSYFSYITVLLLAKRTFQQLFYLSKDDLRKTVFPLKRSCFTLLMD